MDLIHHLLSPEFMPHGYCYLWDPWIVWLHVISDGLITVSYYAIPITLTYLVHKRRDLPFNWMFWLFGVFIMGCGTTHLMEIWNVWHASYLAAGLLKGVTAVVSVATATVLISLLPRILALPSAEQFRAANLRLTVRIAERDRAYAELTQQRTDVLQVRRVEQAMRDTQMQISAILQSAMDAIITVDDQQRIVLFNATAERMFGYTASEAIGQSIEGFIPQRFRAAHAGHIRRFSETGVTTRTMGELGQISGLRADGEEFPIEASISQVTLADGRRLFTVILRDITERRQAEERNHRLAAIVDSSNDAIFSKDLDGVITSWNRGAECLYGYRESEAVGRHVSMLAPPERKAEIPRFLEEIGRGWRVSRFETVRKHKDGTLLEVSLMIAPLRDARGKVIGASTIAHDITERKQSEEKLRENASVLEWAPVLVRDLNARIVVWNKGAEQLYGYSKQEALGERSHALLRTEFPQPLEEIEQHLRRTNHWEGELIHSRKDGSKIVVTSVWTLHRDPKGQPSRVVEVNTDITARKRAEEALREGEERFQTMANGIPQLAWMAEADGSIFWYNQRWYEYTGTTFEQMQGWGWQSVHDAHVLPKVLEGWKSALAAGSPFEMEFPLRGADGIFRVFLTRVQPQRDSQGHVVRWFGTNTDISDRKRAEQRLATQAEELAQQAEELLRSRQALETQTLMLQSVLNSMAEGLVAADEQGKFVIWNPAAEKILGMSAANLPSQEWTTHYGLYLADTVTPFPTEQLPMVRAIRGEASMAEIFVRNPELAEGAWIEASGGPLHNRDGAVSGGVVAFRDITEKKAAENEIRKLNRDLERRVMERTAQLEAAKNEMESFTYSVSHDLRAPLRHIAGFVGILMEDCGPQLDAEARRYLERIQQGTRRMGTLVDELLALARVGRQALSFQRTPLSTLVDDVVAILKAETEDRQVEWKIAELPRINCDPTLIRQVFQNLIANALKYSRNRAPAIIEIGEREEHGQVVIFVRDNGVGFDTKYADKLFGVFQRLHSEKDFEGTGVGLATVQRIVQKHGGRAWAEAAPDKGATFYFTLGPDGATAATAASAGAQP